MSEPCSRPSSPEWLELYDPQTDRVVYANPATGACSWAPPKANVKAHDIAGEWWELHDEETGVPYYYNTRTEATEWEPPENATIVPFHALLSSSVGKRLSIVVANRASIVFCDDQLESIVRKASKASLKSMEGQLSRRGSQAVRREGSSRVRKPNCTNGGSPGSHFNNSPISEATSPVPAISPETPIIAASTEEYAEEPMSDGPDPDKPPESTHCKSSLVPKDLEIGTTKALLEAGTRPMLGAAKGKNRLSSSQRHSQSETALETLKEALESNRSSYQEPSHQITPPAVHTLPSQQSSSSTAETTEGLRKSEHTIASIRRTSIATKSSRLRPSGESSFGQRNRSLPSFRGDPGLYGMRAFASTQFAAQKRGFLRRKVPLDELISHTTETIARPLMNLPREMTKDAVRSFKTIQKFMGDTPASNPNAVFADVLWMANQCVVNQMLRDEVICQIAKQVTCHPDTSAAIKGWTLLAVVMYAFRPSQMLFPHLEGFVSAAKIPDPSIARFVRLQLARARRSASRMTRMTETELRLAMTVPSRPLVFGGSLEQIVESGDLVNRNTGLPRVLEQLTRLIISLGGERTEGLFRVPGDTDQVLATRLAIEAGQEGFDGVSDPNVPASLLKEWLRDLAEPLISDEFYGICVESPEDPEVAAEVISGLSDPAQNVVIYLLSFFAKLLEPSVVACTKMDAGNLALVFGPSFLRNPVSDLRDVFANSSSEQAFLLTLINSYNSSHC